MYRNTPEFGVIVLAGGASRRMGTDKWMLPLGGVTVLERIVQTFQDACAEIWVVASKASDVKDVRKYPDLAAKYKSVRFTYDEIRETGPLGGMMAGIHCSRSAYLLMMAADMPFPCLDLAFELVLRCDKQQAVAAIPQWGGRLHPLFAVYRRECLRSLAAYIEAGGRKVLDWVQSLKPDLMSEQEVAICHPQGIALFNMNRIEDYRLALEIESAKKTN